MRDLDGHPRFFLKNRWFGVSRSAVVKLDFNTHEVICTFALSSIIHYSYLTRLDSSNSNKRGKYHPLSLFSTETNMDNDNIKCQLYVDLEEERQEEESDAAELSIASPSLKSGERRSNRLF